MVNIEPLRKIAKTLTPGIKTSKKDVFFSPLGSKSQADLFEIIELEKMDGIVGKLDAQYVFYY